MSTTRASLRSLRQDYDNPVVLFPGGWNDLLLSPTAGGGWAAYVTGADALATGEYSSLVTVRADVIVQYECTILRLRQEVLHYKRLLSQLSPPREALDEYGQPPPVAPLNPASTRVINSILAARIPETATFLGFDQEEL
jgi:hypothetical protein